MLLCQPNFLSVMNFVDILISHLLTVFTHPLSIVLNRLLIVLKCAFIKEKARVGAFSWYCETSRRLFDGSTVYCPHSAAAVTKASGSRRPETILAPDAGQCSHIKTLICTSALPPSSLSSYTSNVLLILPARLKPSASLTLTLYSAGCTFFFQRWHFSCAYIVHQGNFVWRKCWAQSFLILSYILITSQVANEFNYIAWLMC